ncbi:exonuclease subunit SbcD [Vibrio breoganii]|uniref:Nuclease SbcCD subunit D n=1 Tax=Vibrio breoganii TaxID=553239 RepID=A0ABX1U6N1_9VIBR|nr:exonuclease subunit SbcD [Vibrio breoganii]NMO73485.1 exonuclease subunit SbcD [Vibrio breoganii]NMR70108.1 exonuclease subunit SbcD [Vibrio breoganii]OCH73367.1 exonuclease subunit SbcD [Vibrio breoganii]PMG08514.1 exonuclease subunit SbcD [Vibrio breoganii]PML89207.1 exonuclease subunit SbcD [Vibrio breoganii]
MKILHTSDWHLGQNFFTKSRLAEHEQFIQWLLGTVESEQVDCVIIAGDVFDTGTPPSYARELYNRFVVDMHRLGCQLIVLGGNHDSVAMLNESKQLLKQLHTQVIASVGTEISEQILEITKSSGDVGAIVCAVPFIRPRDVVKSISGESGSEKQKALGEAIKAHYSALYQNALQLRSSKELDVPILATGHLTALGVTTSESVRDIYIGTLDGFAADGFPPADYIALGHIHRPQKVAKSDHIRYSGSPIYLSFDELKSQKQVVLVEFASSHLVGIEPVAIPSFQPMFSLKGDLASLQQQLDSISVEEGASVWVSIEVEVQDYLTDLQQTVQKMIGDREIEVLQLRRSRSHRERTLNQEQAETLSELSPIEVFSKRLAVEVFDSEEDKARQQRITTRFKQIVEDVEGERS